MPTKHGRVGWLTAGAVATAATLAACANNADNNHHHDLVFPSGKVGLVDFSPQYPVAGLLAFASLRENGFTSINTVACQPDTPDQSYDAVPDVLDGKGNPPNRWSQEGDTQRLPGEKPYKCVAYAVGA